MLANVCVVIFFASIEGAYPLLEDVGYIAMAVLLMPELSYAGLLLVVALVLLAWRVESPQATIVAHCQHEIRLAVSDHEKPAAGARGGGGRRPGRSAALREPCSRGSELGCKTATRRGVDLAGPDGRLSLWLSGAVAVLSLVGCETCCSCRAARSSCSA